MGSSPRLIRRGRPQLIPRVELVLTSLANPLLSLRLTSTSTVADVPQSIVTTEDIRRLTRQLAAGDEAAFREFHARYFDRLYQFLLVVTRGQEDEAQEALQLTLLRLLRYARSFDSADVFWSWLTVLARTAARDAARKNQRYLALLRRFCLQRQEPMDGLNPKADESLRLALEEALAELEPRDRHLLESKYLDGAKVRELAADTGLTDKAVESRLLRLRRHVRERLFQKLHGL